MGRVLGDSGTIKSRPGDTLVTSLDADVQAVRREAAAPGDHDSARHLRQGHPPQLRRGQRCRRGDGGQDRPHRGHGQPADVQPGGLVGRHQPQGAQGALLGEGRRPAALPRHAGPVRPGSTFKPLMTVGALNNGFSESTSLDCSSGVQVGNRCSRTTSRPPTATSASPRRSSLLRHLLLPRGPDVLAEVRQRPHQREGQGPAGRDGQEVRLRLSRPAVTSAARPAAGSPTGAGSSPTGRR